MGFSRVVIDKSSAAADSSELCSQSLYVQRKKFLKPKKFVKDSKALAKKKDSAGANGAFISKYIPTKNSAAKKPSINNRPTQAPGSLQHLLGFLTEDFRNGKTMSRGAMRSRFPFTESQWEELEQQAQIFKYIVSGLPVPHHLIFPIRRSSYFSTPTFSSKLFSRASPHLSWNVYEMGVGRKIDPEPGRCRRTDGKKWRCSKEAYPDSKYCERHMHRGKNRSRKPVELPSSSSKSSTGPVLRSSLSLSNDSDLSSSLFSNSSGPKPLNGLALYGQRDLSGSYPSHMDESDPYRRSRYMNMNENGGSLFQMEPSSSVRSFSSSAIEEDSSWGFTPLTIRPTNSYDTENQDKVKADHHCYLLGTEIKQQMPFSFLNHQEEEEEPSKKPVHRFFDEWPQEHREVSSNSSSVSTTLFI